MTGADEIALGRFLETLALVAREGQHLIYSWHRVFDQPVDVEWVRGLETDPERAERLEAFVSRFARMQDTIAQKLLPRWLAALAETPASVIDNLNRAERLGVLESTDRWLEARRLRNRLVHEYMESAETFASDLVLAKDHAGLLVDCYNRMRAFAAERMNIDEAQLPDRLSLNDGQE